MSGRWDTVAAINLPSGTFLLTLQFDAEIAYVDRGVLALRMFTSKGSCGDWWCALSEAPGYNWRPRARGRRSTRTSVFYRWGHRARFSMRLIQVMRLTTANSNLVSLPEPDTVKLKLWREDGGPTISVERASVQGSLLGSVQ